MCRVRHRCARPTSWRDARGLCPIRSEEHTSELQSRSDLVCRLLLEKKKKNERLESRSDGISDYAPYRVVLDCPYHGDKTRGHADADHPMQYSLTYLHKRYYTTDDI